MAIERPIQNPETQTIDLREYAETRRVKTVAFDDITTVASAISQLQDSCRRAESLFPDPLVQTRVILPVNEQGKLLNSVQNLCISRAKPQVVGRIPFHVDGETVAIYTIQAEYAGRPTFTPSSVISFEEMVQRGMQRRHLNHPQALPEGFVLYAVEFTGGCAHDTLRQTPLSNIDHEELAFKLAETHKECFTYPHDPAQQNPEEVAHIITENPVLIIMDTQNEQIASVGYLEQDTRFTFGNIALIEPTYFTHPDYERKGFSSQLRQATQQLARDSERVLSYRGQPMLIFNESVRHTSFPLSIENGCDLAATADLQISGNLGDSYTAIGDANPDIGFMPMGLTYFADPRIAIELPDRYR